MDRVIYLAMAGAKATLQRQDVLAHNLANASTNGFRAEMTAFRAVPVRGDGASTRVYALESTPGYNPEPGPIASTRYPRIRRVVVLGGSAPPAALDWSALIEAGTGVDDATLDVRAQAVDPAAPALMLYTSGTTGSPKGAMHSHAMLRTVADGANRLGITARDAILLFLPLFHSMGLYLGGMLFLVSGARLVLMDRFDAGVALEELEREHGIRRGKQECADGSESVRSECESGRRAKHESVDGHGNEQSPEVWREQTNKGDPPHDVEKRERSNPLRSHGPDE